ncbi:hypothetical protein JKP88DRAFT_278694 [Tribonema minus]|uniref:Uncharacterized protein n=1 Tax=Tribonema minus TaxID=303371 RepID=A0A835YU67_9STRA|nr:hypothetical protein JKP88DRAFT_278694 [Tribonema minus]
MQPAGHPDGSAPAKRRKVKSGRSSASASADGTGDASFSPGAPEYLFAAALEAAQETRVAQPLGPAAIRLHARLAELHASQLAHRLWHNGRNAAVSTQINKSKRWSFKGDNPHFGGDPGTSSMCIATALTALGCSQASATTLLPGGLWRPCDIALLPVPALKQGMDDMGAGSLRALGGSRVWVLELCARCMLDDTTTAQYRGSRPYVEACFAACEEFARSEECRRMRAQVLQRYLQALQQPGGAAAEPVPPGSATEDEIASRQQQFAAQHCVHAVELARAAAAEFRSPGSSALAELEGPLLRGATSAAAAAATAAAAEPAAAAAAVNVAPPIGSTVAAAVAAAAAGAAAAAAVNVAPPIGGGAAAAAPDAAVNIAPPLGVAAADSNAIEVALRQKRDELCVRSGNITAADLRSLSTGQLRQKAAEGRVTRTYFLWIENKQFGPVFIAPEPATLMRDILAALLGVARFKASLVDAADDILVLLGLFASTADLAPAASRAGAAAGRQTHAGHHLRGRGSDILEIVLEGAKALVRQGGQNAAAWGVVVELVEHVITLTKGAVAAAMRAELCLAAARHASTQAETVHFARLDENAFPFWRQLRAVPPFCVAQDKEAGGLCSHLGHLPASLLEERPDHAIALHVNGTKVLATKCAESAAILADLVEMLLHGERAATTYLHPTDRSKLATMPLAQPLWLTSATDGDRRLRRHDYALDALHTKEGRLLEAGEQFEPVMEEIRRLLLSDPEELQRQRALVQLEMLQEDVSRLRCELRQRRQAGEGVTLEELALQNRPRHGEQAAAAAANAALDDISSCCSGTDSTRLDDAYITATADLDDPEIHASYGAMAAAMRQLSAEFCSDAEDEEWVFPLVICGEDIERMVGETGRERWGRVLESVRRHTRLAVAGTQQELLRAFAEGGVAGGCGTPWLGRMHIVLVHGRALPASAVQGLTSWDVADAMPVLWRADRLQGVLVPLKEGETTELVELTEDDTWDLDPDLLPAPLGTLYHRRCWAVCRGVPGTTGRVCRAVVERTVVEWCMQQHQEPHGYMNFTPYPPTENPVEGPGCD